MVKEEESEELKEEKDITKKRKIEEAKKRKIEMKKKKWEEERQRFYEEQEEKMKKNEIERGAETVTNKAFADAKLPQQIITMEIFSRLPVNSLLRFRSVCKAFCYLVKDPYFIKLHTTRSNDNHNTNTDLILQGDVCHLSTFYIFNSIDSDSSSAPPPHWPMKHKLPSKFDSCLLKGSCNGLIYLNGRDTDCFFSVLWNPITREYKRLPEAEPRFKDPPFDSLLKCQDDCSGLGYDSSSGEFKVLKMTTFLPYSSFFHVYTLSSNSWRMIDYTANDNWQSNAMFFTKKALPWPASNMFFANGALHWSAGYRVPPYNFNVLMSFSIKEEKFGEVPRPNFDGGRFCVFKGTLCLFRHFLNLRAEIWVMKDYGVKESWTKMFTIEHPMVTGFRYYYAVIFLKNDEALFAGNYNEIILYNLKNGMIRKFPFYGLESWTALMGTGSLVSLNTVNANEKTKVIMGSSVNVYEDSQASMDELSMANYDARELQQRRRGNRHRPTFFAWE